MAARESNRSVCGHQSKVEAGAKVDVDGALVEEIPFADEFKRLGVVEVVRDESRSTRRV